MGETVTFQGKKQNLVFDLEALKRTHKNPFFNISVEPWSGYQIEEITNILQNSNLKVIEIGGGITTVEVEGFKPGFSGNPDIIGKTVHVFSEFLK